MKKKSKNPLHIHQWISCGAVGFWVCIECWVSRSKIRTVSGLDGAKMTFVETASNVGEGKR